MRLLNKIITRIRSGLTRLIDCDRGQALVELSVAVTLLVLLLLGAVEFGSMAYQAIELSDAAMAGAQYGTQNTTTVADTNGISTAASNDAPNLTGLQTTSSYGCICSNGNASTCATTDCSGSHIEYILTVKTQASFTPTLHVPGFSSAYTLKGQAIQKVMQ
jgi:Flp pilus assembly protein TadG